jgi:nucleoside-diphosphate-sugar epimerase
VLSAGHTRLPSRAASSSWTRRPCSASSAFAFLGLLGQPLRFPGSPAAYDALYQVTDAELLGRATVWAGSEPAADGEVYNVTNGDQLRWRHLWPLFAAHVGMSYAEPPPVPPAGAMADRRDVWERLATRHDLVPIDYADRGGLGVRRVHPHLRLRQRQLDDQAAPGGVRRLPGYRARPG